MVADAEETPPHAVPAWPLNCLTFYRHLADDYGRCVRALGKATDPAQAARAEGDYGVRVMHDVMQAWYDLLLSPFTAMAKAMTTEPPSASVQPAPDKPASAKTA
jgi:hypothetical protein